MLWGTSRKPIAWSAARQTSLREGAWRRDGHHACGASSIALRLDDAAAFLDGHKLVGLRAADLLALPGGPANFNLVNPGRRPQAEVLAEVALRDVARAAQHFATCRRPPCWARRASSEELRPTFARESRGGPAAEAGRRGLSFPASRVRWPEVPGLEPALSWLLPVYPTYDRLVRVGSGCCRRQA
jgi:hypothetical protein